MGSGSREVWHRQAYATTVLFIVCSKIWTHNTPWHYWWHFAWHLGFLLLPFLHCFLWIRQPSRGSVATSPWWLETVMDPGHGIVVGVEAWVVAGDGGITFVISSYTLHVFPMTKLASQWSRWYPQASQTSSRQSPSCWRWFLRFHGLSPCRIWQERW